MILKNKMNPIRENLNPSNNNGCGYNSRCARCYNNRGRGVTSNLGHGNGNNFNFRDGPSRNRGGNFGRENNFDQNHFQNNFGQRIQGYNCEKFDYRQFEYRFKENVNMNF